MLPNPVLPKFRSRCVSCNSLTSASNPNRSPIHGVTYFSISRIRAKKSSPPSGSV